MRKKKQLKTATPEQLQIMKEVREMGARAAEAENQDELDQIASDFLSYATGK